MRPTYTALALLTVLALPGGGVAQDVEEILSYDVAVEIDRNANMTVTEAITVRALGDEIRRGIYRDFPTSFPRRTGLGRIEAPFEVASVLRDGQQERYDLSSIGTSFGRGGIRVRVGDPNVFLDPGVYTYEITYRTSRWVHFGDEGTDELYWNVTGNGWGLPIRSASARVMVAGLAVEPQLDAWTGPEGSTEQDAVAAWDPTGGAYFETTGGLGAREGMTVSVRFPSGLLVPPSEAQAAEWFRLDWGGYVDAGYIVLLVVALYLLMWRRIGRDPAPGHVVVQYEPPRGFSPAGMGFLKKRGFDKSQLAAAVVSMAVKGALRIDKDGSTWRLHLEDASADLSPDERAAFGKLLGDRSQLSLKQSNHKAIGGAMKALKKKLAGRLEREYFVTNRLWFVLGLVVSIAGFGALAWRWRYGIEPAALFLGLWLTGWSAGTGTMVWRAVTDITLARRGAGVGHWAAGLGMGCFSIPFIAAWCVVSYLLVGMVPTHLLLAAIAIGVTNVVFYHLLERPTLKGRGVLNQLEGFERFLAATDEDRLDRTMKADPTPELFERFLPHAIALGLENQWASRFEWVLDPTGEMGTHGTFRWYAGGSGAIDATSLSSSLGAAFTSTLSSASSAPSSGGSGGGGSSGGGGGGGGGGGW